MSSSTGTIRDLDAARSLDTTFARSTTHPFAPSHPQVIAFDPYLSDERAVTLGVEKVELDDLFRRSDFITLHVPLTPETRGVINATNIAKMKQGVRIVNCARGELVNEADLLAGLESGHVAGAALDVFSEEPAKKNILFGNEKVVCTPHLGASSVEAQFNVAYQVAEQLSDFLVDGAITNALNVSSSERSEMDLHGVTDIFVPISVGRWIPVVFLIPFSTTSLRSPVPLGLRRRRPPSPPLHETLRTTRPLRLPNHGLQRHPQLHRHPV